MRAVSTRASGAPDTARIAGREPGAIRTLPAIERRVRTVPTVDRHKIAAKVTNDAFAVTFAETEIATERGTTELALSPRRAGLARQYRNHQIFDFECHKATPGEKESCGRRDVHISR